MSEVIPFKKPQREYKYSKHDYLWFILTGLTKIHGNDNAAKADFILKACPFISIGRLEQFQRKVSAATVAHYAKIRQEEAESDEMKEWTDDETANTEGETADTIGGNGRDSGKHPAGQSRRNPTT